jgi:hypothetical protein
MTVETLERHEVLVGATAFVGHARPPRRYPSGRVCHHPGCDTRLSIYNASELCYRHERPALPRLRGRAVA